MKPARGGRLSRIPPPAGVLIFGWKSVVELGRRAPPLSIAGTLAADVFAGFVVGRFSSRYDDAVTASLFFVIINIMVVVGVGASSTLAGEVRRPLFWLSATPLFERLCALLLARVWQTVLLFEFAAAGIALGGGRPIQTLLFAVGLPVLAGLLAGVGFAAFALFPSAADARGPVALMRIGFSLVILIPPLALDAVGSALFGAALPALTAAALLATIEAGALVGIAAWRLDGHVDRLAA